MAEKKTASPRAKRVWKRLIEWYGVRFGEQYGDEPPEDWAAAVDDCDNEAVKKALSLIRSRYIQHPPTLPQFEQCMRPPPVISGPSAADRLCTYVMHEYGSMLTEKQRQAPWTYIGTADGITGVIIDPDGEFPGYRVMLRDMHSAAA